MEHRWGERVAVDIPVRLTVLHPFFWIDGQLVNLSPSGGCIAVDFDFRLLARIQVVVDIAAQNIRCAGISAYVTRKYQDQIGIEWCEFAHATISGLLRSLTTRSYEIIGQIDRANRQTRLSSAGVAHRH